MLISNLLFYDVELALIFSCWEVVKKNNGDREQAFIARFSSKIEYDFTSLIIYLVAYYMMVVEISLAIYVNLF